MNILTHNDNVLDHTVEHEIREPKGMQVIVLFKNGKYEVYDNITEVHWMYTNPLFKDAVAIESDILSTGWTHFIAEVEIMIIK